MNVRICTLALLVMVLGSCGQAKSGTSGGDAMLGAGQALNPNDSGTVRLPGQPGLSAGLVATPEYTGESVPHPKYTARAGKDFASNRFIVVFEEQPDQSALARYLIGGNAADAVSATDNAPLVNHPYYRRVSTNLAARYGLTLRSRVFFKGLNFAVYELAALNNVSQLDGTMRDVLAQNRGLVREVCYDFYVYPTGILDSAGQTVPSPLSPELTARLLQGNPAGFKSGPGAPARQTSTAPNDPMHLNRSGSGGGTWANWRIGAVDGRAWSQHTGSNNVLVALIDTGARMTHEDLAGNVITPANTAPFNAPGILTDVQSKDNDPSDGYGHGTIVGGCIGAVGNNGLGLSGICQTVRILPIKIFDDFAGGGTDAVVAEAIALADYLDADIQNMSIGGPFPDRLTQLAIDQATADGRLCVVAAGNWNTSAPSYPGAYTNALTVGATTLINASGNVDFNGNNDLTGLTRYDGRASFSQYGAWVDIAAPGVEVRSAWRSADNAYVAAVAGTSVACPYCAGSAALLWSYILSQGDEPTSEQVRGLLLSSASEMTVLCNSADPKGFLNSTSNGTTRFLNLKGAMDLYDSGSTTLPEIDWDNPANGDVLSGTVELRIAVSAPDSTVLKVQFETPTRLLGTVTAPDSGLYKLNWDTTFEFNRDLRVTAKAYDDKGSIATSTIQVTPSNSHVAPPWTEDFTGLANDAMPSGWFMFDGNQGTSNTSWGGNTSEGSAAAPCMKSTGSSAIYASQSKDWLFAPVIDLANQGNAQLSAQEKHTLVGADAYMLFTTDDMYYYGDWLGNGTAGWSAKNYDLSFLAGKEVRVFWVFDRNGGGANGGMYVDDVAVSGTSGTPPSITIDAPSGGDSLAGVVPIDVTVSDDSDQVWLEAAPPALGKLVYSSIPDNDPGATKTFSMDWDSRHTYYGGAVLTAYAATDINDDGIMDLITPASVAVSVDNITRDPQHFEGFEDITTLGGISSGQFDGDWYTWGNSGSAFWRIGTSGAHTGSQLARLGPSGAGNYEANELEQLYSPVTQLDGAAHPYLRLWHKIDVESGNSDDFGKLLLVRYNGLADSELPMAEFRGDVGSWSELSFNLADFAADPLRFNFVFYSDGDTNLGTGWQLDDFELLDADPHIDSMSPHRGVAGSSSDIVISGARFGQLQGSSSVLFTKKGGGTTVGSIESWSDTAITARIPADAASGDAIVRVLGHDSNGYDFRVVLDAPNLGGLGQQ